ncbi:MAG: hypothetical protein OCD76_23910 [Reichenbachiella sp.]
MKLKKYLNYSLLALAATFVFASCDDLEDIIPDEDVDPKEYTVSFDLTDSENGNATVIASQVDSTEFTAFVKFTTTGDKMKRVYMTLNNNGAGDEIYELESNDVDKKGDGSIDLTSAQEETFTFILPFPLLSSGTGTYEYKIWSTTGKGDYRDMDKNFSVGIGTIVVDYESANPDTEVREFETTIFAAPLADGTSQTFASTLDGTVYKIVPEGDLTDEEIQEYVSFWDFGYYYGFTGKASFASTFDYPTSIVDVVTLAGLTDNSELNHAYFMLSNTTVTEFDAITNSSELDFISASSEEDINGLVVDNIVEFVDNYGKKGLIKVVRLVEGDGSNGQITIDIKVQP